jgi:hypothetical protein
MSANAAWRLSFSWDRSECLALAALLVAWLAALGASGGRRGLALGTPMHLDGGKVASVREQIDPNTASVASLRRLPMVGPVRAWAIVQFRQQAGQTRPVRAFRCPEDLQQVRGIGPGIAGQLREFLSFPPGPETRQGLADSP